MTSPILASSFVGIEAVIILPAIVLSFIAGSICLWSRFRPGAFFFGIISFLTGAYSFLFASDVLNADIKMGCAGILVALFLCLFKRKPKKPISDHLPATTASEKKAYLF
jgi:hypothetical protein